MSIGSFIGGVVSSIIPGGSAIVKAVDGIIDDIGVSDKERLSAEVEMRKLGIEEQKIEAGVFTEEVKDKGNAREMAVKTSLWPQIVIGGVFIVGFFLIVYDLMNRTAELPAGIKETLILLFGVIVGSVKDVVGFWFGSSYGSKEKNDQQFAVSMKNNNNS